MKRKSIEIFVAIILGLAVTWFVWKFGITDDSKETTAEPPRGQYVSDERACDDENDVGRKQSRALQLINHINWVVCKIDAYNDPVVLEEEYKALNPSALRLDSIDDVETVNVIKQLLNLLVDMRIDAKEREFLEQDREDEMANLLRESVPDVGACLSPNPYVAAAKLAGAVFNSAMAYDRGKKKIQKQFERANWQLDKQKLYNLNDLNKNLLENHWALVKKYHLDDRKRVVGSDLSELVNRLKDTNVRRCYAYLIDHEKTFRYFPLYWYYRASLSYSINDDEGTMDAVRGFEEIYVQILRRDKMAANVAMLKVAASLRRKVLNKADIAKALDVIDSNVGYDDWNMLLYSAMMRASICGDKEMAQQRLSDVVSALEYKSETRLLEWKGLLGKKNALAARVKKLNALQDSGRKEWAKRQAKADAQGKDIGRWEDTEECKKNEKELHDIKVEQMSDEDPNVGALYACRTALMKLRTSMYKHEEMSRIAKTVIEKESTSAQEKLYLFGLVRTEDIATAIKGQIASDVRIELKAFPCLTDSIYVKMPYTWFFLPNGFELVFLADGNEVCVVGNPGTEVIKDGEEVKLRFRKELDQLPHSVSHVAFRFSNDDMKFLASFRLPKRPGEKVKSCKAEFESIRVNDHVAMHQ